MTARQYPAYRSSPVGGVVVVDATRLVLFAVEALGVVGVASVPAHHSHGEAAFRSGRQDIGRPKTFSSFSG